LDLTPDIADEAPWSDSLTDYDLDHLAVYLRLLDAESAGADWREATLELLGRRTADQEAAARRCWETHMARARWMTHTGYKLLLAQPPR
jgi:hypothetical protein